MAVQCTLHLSPCKSAPCLIRPLQSNWMLLKGDLIWTIYYMTCFDVQIRNKTFAFVVMIENSTEVVLHRFYTQRLSVPLHLWKQLNKAFCGSKESCPKQYLKKNYEIASTDVTWLLTRGTTHVWTWNILWSEFTKPLRPAFLSLLEADSSNLSGCRIAMLMWCISLHIMALKT